ncbi:MAG: retroviral-like aspartic protease family protein [Bacteroidia bacterium]|nr:retroviral-like aspartic protease family protein [Bacteroidia bacterium]
MPIEFIEIEEGNFHLFIHAKIGRKKARLLLDTGASKTAFDQEQILKFVDESTLHKYEINSIGLGSNQVETHLSSLPSLKFGDIKLSKHEIAVLDLSHVNHAYKILGYPPIDGVMGSDLLYYFRALIDYKNSRLVIEMKGK